MVWLNTTPEVPKPPSGRLHSMGCSNKLDDQENPQQEQRHHAIGRPDANRISQTPQHQGQHQDGGA